MLYKNLDIDASILAENIRKIGNKCIDHGVVKVAIPSIFVKKSIRLSSLTRKVNDEPRVLCSINNFHFISNDNITRKHLYEDGVHLTSFSKKYQYLTFAVADFAHHGTYHWKNLEE